MRFDRIHVTAAILIFSTLELTLALGQSTANSSIGVFDGQLDIGEVQHAGSATFDAQQQTYVISGSGTNMWFGKDEFHFVWVKMKGDFVLRTHAAFLGEGVDPHRKIGWMVRKSLTGDSPYIDATVHGDGLTSMQYRLESGADTLQVQSEVNAPDVIQLARRGSTYSMSVAKHGELLSDTDFSDIDLGDEVYVGLFVCSHNPDVVEQAEFRNVRIIKPAAADFRPYRDYIGSQLEIMSVADGHRTIVHAVDDSMQAPNWTRDGKSLITNRNGKLYQFDIASGNNVLLDTGDATQNNNDHVISFDGKLLGISNHTGESRKSVIYTLPVEGGKPNRVTTLEHHSYLHGWSADDKHLIYTAERNGDYDIFRIPVSGGEEVNLTNSPGLDDGSEYTPDGSKIYFNSTRSGLMQIWRMNPDGSQQEQVTDDEFNNWFPHISPDGKSIVFISYDKGIAPDDHPFYQHCYIRHLPIEGGKPSVIAYVYGGQGTINVPSWSPDSKQIAFVSNNADPEIPPAR